MKIYTKRGDNGFSDIGNGKMISKSNKMFDIIGTIDELNCVLGFLHNSKDKNLKKEVIRIQAELFELGLILTDSKDYKKSIPLFEMYLKNIEDNIDKIDVQLPPLKNFILPGGASDTAHLHLARVVCRRLERVLVSKKESRKDTKILVKYLNRLSDYLFVLARLSNFKNKFPDIVWKRNQLGNKNK